MSDSKKPFVPEMPPFGASLHFKEASYSIKAVKDKRTGGTNAKIVAMASNSASRNHLSMRESFALACIQYLLELTVSDEISDEDFVHRMQEVCGKGKQRDRMVRCEWMRSGNLLLRKSNETVSYLHANTVEEALKRKRIFTTSMSVFKSLENVNRNK